ncbi:ThiS family protein [Colletotrichum tamarilloi]|uniref:ThiS family protein n=1 Tax=Colletotrichum tamarilloi TaxID=1209934 RepID=A0ABQ9R0F6_9PEZI|nr:ThiS family protein [Colletotrichum tamarilloi]KAK1490862.1 ThiS family protein [Colletotrichum tamarilloi]
MAAAPRPPKDHFNVLFFASAGSFTSKQYEVLPAPLPLKKLFDALEERHGGFKERFLESCLVTVNLEYVDIPGPDDEDGPILRSGDEVAIIPPRTPSTIKATNKTTMNVDTMEMMDVRLVIVETWQPNGLVRNSHRSAQCGQTFSS